MDAETARHTGARLPAQAGTERTAPWILPDRSVADDCRRDALTTLRQGGSGR